MCWTVISILHIFESLKFQLIFGWCCLFCKTRITVCLNVFQPMKNSILKGHAWQLKYIPVQIFCWKLFKVVRYQVTLGFYQCTKNSGTWWKFTVIIHVSHCFHKFVKICEKVGEMSDQSEFLCWKVTFHTDIIAIWLTNIYNQAEIFYVY